MYRCHTCPRRGLCARCRARYRTAVRGCQRRRRARADADRALALVPRGRADPWLLAEDGIFDSVAVDAAALGGRRVRLTARERSEAAMRVILGGGNGADIIRRLSLPVSGEPFPETGTTPGKEVRYGPVGTLDAPPAEDARTFAVWPLDIEGEEIGAHSYFEAPDEAGALRQAAESLSVAGSPERAGWKVIRAAVLISV